MTAQYNSSGYPAADVGDDMDDFVVATEGGVRTALTCCAASSDPSTAAPVTWGAAEVGRLWFDTGVDGSAANPVLKQWCQLDGTPTYGWRRLRLRKVKWLTAPQAVTFSPASPAAADVAFTDVDLSALLDGAGVQDTGDNTRLVSGVWLRILVRTGASETIPGGDNCYFAVRQKGATVEQRVRPQVANLYVEETKFVPLDSDEIFQFAVDVGGGTAAFEYSAWVLGFVEEV